MTITRRDVLWSLGGGLAGAAVTPLPWKLLDDTAIWTQRRHVLPVPPRGPVTYRPTACTLCPAGCALRVRCVGTQPVAVAGEARHPLGGGACALGLTLHHLACHPLRLVGPAVCVNGRRESATLDAAVERIARAVENAHRAGLRVMVLDRRPGRVVSAAWQRLLAACPQGLYYARRRRGDAGRPAGSAGKARHPRRRPRANAHARELRRAGAGGMGTAGEEALAVRQGLRVVQVDAWRSPSAALADEWVAISPGGEGPLALALAHVVVREQKSAVSDDLRRVLGGFSPRDSAPRTGVEPDRVEALAHALVRQTPTVAIGGGDPGAGPLSPDAERAIALLDVVLGSVGREGGFIPRRPRPEAGIDAVGTPGTALEDVPAGSVGLLLLDAADDGRALPWPLLRRVLAKGAVVVSLSPFDGALAREADVLVPAPAPLEAWDEVLPTADASVASYSVSAPVLPPSPGATDTVALVQRLAAALGPDVGKATHEERLRERVAAIHAARRGRLVARTTDGYADETAADAAALWEALVAGGCWIDEPQRATPLEVRAPLPVDGLARALEPAGTRGERPGPRGFRRARHGRHDAGLAAAHQALPGVGPAALGPDRGREPGGGRAPGPRRPATGPDRERGRRAVHAELRIDPALPPGRIALAAGPDPGALHPGTSTQAGGAQPLAVAAADGTWRETRVRIREA